MLSVLVVVLGLVLVRALLVLLMLLMHQTKTSAGDVW